MMTVNMRRLAFIPLFVPVVVGLALACGTLDDTSEPQSPVAIQNQSQLEADQQTASGSSATPSASQAGDGQTPSDPSTTTATESPAATAEGTQEAEAQAAQPTPRELTEQEMELMSLGIIPPGADRLLSPTAEDEYDIISVLPRDAILAIFAPRLLPVEEAQEQYSPGEMVLGLSINGDHRAYSVPHLSSHEIVNDVVGGVPVAITW